MTPQQLEKRTKQLATQVNLAPGRLPDVADDLAQVVATAAALLRPWTGHGVGIA